MAAAEGARIAGALVTPLSMPAGADPYIPIYNKICREVARYKQIIVRNGDTIHDFGGSRGQVGDGGDEYRRIKDLITAEKTALNAPPLGVPHLAQYTGILDKYNNLTQGSNFEDTMFRGLLPPQMTFVYGNTPGGLSDEYTRLVISTDSIEDLSAAKIARNEIYRFLWGEPTAGAEFKIMADVSPGNEIKKIATVTDAADAVKIRVRVTPESVMDAGPTYNANNDKILPGFGEFVASPLDDKWHPTPVYSLPYVGIRTRVRRSDDYGVNNPKAFDVIFQKQQADGNGPTLTIPHDEYDSGPGVEYIARSAAGVPVGEIKAGMLPFYDIIRNGAYSGAAHAVGLLNIDGTLTDLGKNIGYDLKREGDQSQAIAVLLSYRAGEKVVLATQDRMLALFMILMGGPVIHVGTGKTTIYRGEPITLDPERRLALEEERLRRDINEVTTPILDERLTDSISTLITNVRNHIRNMIMGYVANTGKLYPIPYGLLMTSLRGLYAGIRNLRDDYTVLVGTQERIREQITGIEGKPLSDLRVLRNDIMAPSADATSKMASVTAALDKLKDIRGPFKKIKLGKYGYIDLPAVNRLNKLIKRYIGAARTRFRSKKIFEGFKESLISGFGVLYDQLPDSVKTGSLGTIKSSLLSLTRENPNIDMFSSPEMMEQASSSGKAAVAAAELEAPAAVAAEEASSSGEAAAAAGPPAPLPAAGLAAAAAAPAAVPDINTVTNINTPYEFCVRVVDLLYSTIRPLIMFGKGRTEDVLGQMAGRRDNAETTAKRRVKEFHSGMVRELGRAKRDAASTESARQRRLKMKAERRQAAHKHYIIISQIADDAISTLELKIDSLIDDTHIPIDILPLANDTYKLLVSFRDILLSSELRKGLRMLQTMRGILVEGAPRIIPYDDLYRIHTLPTVLRDLFTYCIGSAVPVTPGGAAAAPAAAWGAPGGAPGAAPAAPPAPAAAASGSPEYPWGPHLLRAFGRKSMPSQTKRHSRKCPRGTIRRKGYKTKRGVTVRSSCIKDRGLPGKGKRLFTLKKGELSKHGYSLKYAREKRHAALNKARKVLSHATLVRKINALAVLMKNTHPDYARRARADVKWLGKTRA